jgi:hypothetical protein
MGQSYGFCRIFLPDILRLDFWPNMAISYQPYVAAPGQPGRQAHGGTALAPQHHVRCPWDFLGLINTSRMSLVRNNERYLAFPLAVSPAVSRGIRSARHFFLSLPLVHVLQDSSRYCSACTKFSTITAIPVPVPDQYLLETWYIRRVHRGVMRTAVPGSLINHTELQRSALITSKLQISSF